MCNDINVHNRVLGGEKKDVYQALPNLFSSKSYPFFLFRSLVVSHGCSKGQAMEEMCLENQTMKHQNNMSLQSLGLVAACNEEKWYMFILENFKKPTLNIF